MLSLLKIIRSLQDEGSKLELFAKETFDPSLSWKVLIIVFVSSNFCLLFKEVCGRIMSPSFLIILIS